MLINKSKWMTLVLVLCFAFLQAMQPFIHVHLFDANHSVQHSGFHVPLDHEELLSAENLSELVEHDSVKHTLSVVPHASHTVLIATAIKNDNDPALVFDQTFLALLLCILIIFQIIISFSPQQTLFNLKFYKRRLPSVRAPPHF